MDLKDLNYILYMESKDLQKKGYNNLSESEKVNLKLNPYAEILTPTTGQISRQHAANPKIIPLSVNKKINKV